MLQGDLNPEMIALLQREVGSEIRAPEVKHFQYVVAIADDANPDQVPVMIGNIVRVFVEHHATVEAISSSLLVALLGVPFPENDSAGARRELVDALVRENGYRIRIVHGECDGAVGVFGGHGTWTYGAVIPGFSGLLKKLVETEFGTVVEIA
jgi:hypothetical protein